MEKKTIWFLGAAILAIFVIGWMVVGSGKPDSGLGAVGQKLVENYIPVIKDNGGIRTALPMLISGTFQMGSSGTAINRLNIGTCYFAPDSATIAASSTQKVTCQGTAVHEAGISALTGVADGDSVNVTLSSTTAGTVDEGWIAVIGATASSTQGYIELLIWNGTGATYTFPVDTAASGTASYISGN